MDQQSDMRAMGRREESEVQSLPFVIDNQRYNMSDALNALLRQYSGQSLDIATASFTIEGWQLLADGISAMGSFRLLLGDEPEAGGDIELRKVGAQPVKGLLKNISNAPVHERMLRLVEDLTAFLCEEHVEVRLYTKGFLHAKCSLFYSGGYERFNPVAAIVGSSNFTRPGLLSNKELNLVHRANLLPEEIGPERLRGLIEKEARKRLAQLDSLDRGIAANIPGVLAINELAEWYDQQWEDVRDFKEALIDLLDASKFR
jgi:phosphatidylserine/phosphatidylglycerophosphate/cardiolipin synthase-like enzyme